MPMDADLLSISQDGMVLDGDVKLSSDLFVNSVHLPADADYANAATGSLVPKSYMPSRQHAFTQGLDHALVTDTEKDANYYNNTQPDALWYYATSKWGPYTISQTEYARRSRVFTAVVPWAETQTPAFRYASFGSPPSGQSVAVINAFPHAQSTLIDGLTLFLRGLQIGSGGGGNLISVKVRVHDTAVGTGLYDDEVVREADLASNEAVSVNGSFADGRWSWKKSLAWAGVGRITMNAGSAYRVSLRITLSSPVAQADTNTYATVHLRNLSATFNAQTFSGSVPAPTATATTITVTHSLAMSGGTTGRSCVACTAPPRPPPPPPRSTPGRAWPRPSWWHPRRSTATVTGPDTGGTAVQSTAGGNVLRMNDKKNLASGYHVSQSNSAKTPTLDTTELNGKTSLRFINSRSGLLTSSSSTFWGSIGTKSSVVIVAKQLITATYPDTNNPGTTDYIRGFMFGSTTSPRPRRARTARTPPPPKRVAQRTPRRRPSPPGARCSRTSPRFFNIQQAENVKAGRDPVASAVQIRNSIAPGLRQMGYYDSIAGKRDQAVVNENKRLMEQHREAQAKRIKSA
eukprot:jgi/Mesvir1/13706/Mv06936-RA.1